MNETNKSESIPPAEERKSNFQKMVTRFALVLMTGALIYANFSLYPFAKTVSSKSVSLRPLSFEQKNNLNVAAQRLNGLVIRPGETFSFNAAVGPRTGKRGYQPAPSYLGAGGESPQTLGGGICLLSSCLYQNALAAGMPIVERVPHLRTVRTVPPGLDATVWYGSADLRFKNQTDCPIQIKTEMSDAQLKVQLLGNSEAVAKSGNAELRRVEAMPAPGELLVEVFRTERGKDIFVSRDLYRTR